MFPVFVRMYHYNGKRFTIVMWETVSSPRGKELCFCCVLTYHRWDSNPTLKRGLNSLTLPCWSTVAQTVCLKSFLLAEAERFELSTGYQPAVVFETMSSTCRTTSLLKKLLVYLLQLFWVLGPRVARGFPLYQNGVLTVELTELGTFVCLRLWAEDKRFELLRVFLLCLFSRQVRSAGLRQSSIIL